jgi:hypothetical protein
MEPLEQLRLRIAGFPGYEGDLDRRRSDEFVRSYLGEALAELSPRCGKLPSELQARLDQLLLRVGFSAPKAFAAHNSGLGIPSGTLDGEIAAEDVATIELADWARSTTADSLSGYLDEVTAALDRRDAVMRAAATQS